MILSRCLAVVPVLALAFTGMATVPAGANTDALSTDAVDALAVAACQLDPAAPLTAAEMAPELVAEADFDVVAGEITVHVVRARVNTSQADVRECTFGVLHRDSLLKQVQYAGTVTLAVGSAYSAVTDVEIGNMGIGSAVDATAEVPLAGFLVPLSEVDADPTYSVSLERKSLEVVQIAVKRAQENAAGKLLKTKVKAAAHLEKKQLKAAKAKHSAKAVAAARKGYDKRVAAAQRAYDRATSPKTVTRPVSQPYSIVGTVAGG